MQQGAACSALLPLCSITNSQHTWLMQPQQRHALCRCCQLLLLHAPNVMYGRRRPTCCMVGAARDGELPLAPLPSTLTRDLCLTLLARPCCAGYEEAGPCELLFQQGQLAECMWVVGAPQPAACC